MSLSHTHKVVLVGIAGLIASTSGTAYAAAAPVDLIRNGSFEEGAWLDSGPGWMNVDLTSRAISGWTVATNNIAWSSPANSDGVMPSDGIRSLDLTGLGNVTPNGGVTQNVATTVGKTYLLSFDLGTVVHYGVASLQVLAGETSQTFQNTADGWRRYSLEFTATTASTAVSFMGLRANDAYYIGLDNVSIPSVSAVPEPETYAMFLAGLGMMGTIARRRRNQASS